MQKGMSQQILADRAELHRTYLTGIERGKRNLSLLMISKLASALGISIGALFPAGSARSEQQTESFLSQERDAALRTRQATVS